MKIAININIEDDYYDEEIFGVINITPELAKEYLSLIDTASKMVNENQKFFKICIFDYNLIYLSNLDENTYSQFETLNTKEHIELDNSTDLNALEEKYEERIEGSVLNIYSDSICWDGYIKHTSIRIITPDLTKEYLESILKNS